MDIIAENLSANTFKSSKVLVNGQDIMDYIRSKLSVAVEFNGVYDSLEAANVAEVNFNGSIVIVGSTEYIWYDKDNKWHEIGDETVVGQIASDVETLSGNMQFIASISADLSCEHKLSAEAGSMAYENANDYALNSHNHDGTYLKEVPSSYKTYQAALSSLSSDGYVLSSNVMPKVEILQQFNGSKAYSDAISSYANMISTKVDNLSNDLVYASTYVDTSLEELTASLGDAGVRKLVFMPSYFGMKSSDSLTSIALQTRSDNSQYGIASAYIRVRKYNGLGDVGEVVGKSNYFTWPTDSRNDVQIEFSQPIQFAQPNAQYYFECLSSENGLVNVFGMTMRVLNTGDSRLPEISSHYFVTGIYNGVETIFAQLRPPLSVGYRHPYSMAELEAKTNAKYNELIGETSDLSSASTINAAKKYAKNLVDSFPEGLSSYAATVANLSNDGYALTSQLSTAADISTAIGLQQLLDAKNKVEVAQTFEDTLAQTDLSIIKVVDEDLPTYATALHDNTLNPNALYVLQLSAPNAFGQTINNVADGQISSDAATVGQLSGKENISNKVSVLLSTSTNDQYPTAKCMYDIIGNIESALDIINNGGAQ